MRVVALVDGEHYPPTTRWGLQSARAMGHEVVAALFVGGSEKVAADGSLDLGDVPVLLGGEDPARSLRVALEEHRPEGVLDLSDEPILGYRERMALAAVALSLGASYVGPDFRLDPPIREAPLPAPTLAVIGTGKRTGKTAIAGEAARVAAAAGLRPVVVAMGRGGMHAASDYLEDALTTGVTTVGARRAGGGLAGRPFVSNVRQAAELALREDPGLVLLEGSGAAIPPIPWDAGVLVAAASAPREYLAGYLGPFRLLLSDLVVLTMARSPDVGPEDLAYLTSLVRRLRPDARVVVTDFRPVPLNDVGGKKVYFATTAPESVGPALVSYLEEAHGCDVVGTSHSLSDRGRLAKEIDAASAFDVLLTELKAAAIDVAAERARARGAEVVFADNRAETLEGDGDLPELLEDAANLAVERARDR